MASNLLGPADETMTRVSQPDITTETIGGLMTHWAMAVGDAAARRCWPPRRSPACSANVIQNKPGFTPAAIRPDFKKVSPIGGIKRLVRPARR